LFDFFHLVSWLSALLFAERFAQQSADGLGTKEFLGSRRDPPI